MKCKIIKVEPGIVTIQPIVEENDKVVIPDDRLNIRMSIDATTQKDLETELKYYLIAFKSGLQQEQNGNKNTIVMAELNKSIGLEVLDK